MKISYKIWLMLTGVSVVFTQCTDPQMDDDFKQGAPPPIGNYVSSSEIAPTELVAFFPFDGTATDAKGGVTGGTVSGSGSFVTGKKGQAYQGGTGVISYGTAGPLANLTSFTVSMWINTTVHSGGAQGVFAVSKEDGSFWSNFFMIIEGANPGDNMLAKVHFEKNAAGVSNVEHWLETTGAIRQNFMGNMYGAWRHVAFSYDQTTSKYSMYVNGNKLPFKDPAIPRNDEDRFASPGVPLGALAFKNANRFVIGGFQNQLGAPYNSPEVWMLPYTGKLDELRFYKKALTDQEVNALFQLEKQGR